MPELDWPRIAAAVAADDWDAALTLGLLEWDGDDAAPRQAGLSSAQTADIAALYRQRQTALAARARYQARNARLARLEAEQRQRRAAALAPVDDDTAQTPKLTGAAAAALARALAKAKK